MKFSSFRSNLFILDVYVVVFEYLNISVICQELQGFLNVGLIKQLFGKW